MPAWPKAIPTPLAESFEIRPGNNLLRTDMESGEARQRRRFLSVPTQYAIRCEFSRAEMAVFEAWWRHEIEDGAARFEMPIPTGQGIEILSARFIGPYEARLRPGESFEITATIEARRPSTMTPEQLAPYL